MEEFKAESRVILPAAVICPVVRIGFDEIKRVKFSRLSIALIDKQRTDMM
ncbi:MAG TPA: hypothetical protein VG722_08550 [Tepidisphaeraceae bacterium]|nr:hypothetical protein [Tepidisphaeraceae bacterium]